MTEQERAQWRASDYGQPNIHGDVTSLDEVMALVIRFLEQSQLYQLEDSNCSVLEAGASMAVSLQANRERVEMEVCIYTFPLLLLSPRPSFCHHQSLEFQTGWVTL